MTKNINFEGIKEELKKLYEENPVNINFETYKLIYQKLENTGKDSLKEIAEIYKNLSELNKRISSPKSITSRTNSSDNLQSSNLIDENSILHELISNVGSFCYNQSDENSDPQIAKRETVNKRVKIISDFLTQNTEFFDKADHKGRLIIHLMLGLFDSFDKELLELAIEKTGDLDKYYYSHPITPRDSKMPTGGLTLLDILIAQKLFGIDEKDNAKIIEEKQKKIFSIVDKLTQKGVTLSYNNSEVIESLLHSRSLSIGLTEKLCFDLINKDNVDLFIALLKKASGKISSSRTSDSSRRSSGLSTPRSPAIDQDDVSTFVKGSAKRIINNLIDKNKIHLTNSQEENVFILLLKEHLKYESKQEAQKNPLEDLWTLLQRKDSVVKFGAELFYAKDNDGKTILHHIVRLGNKNLIDGFIARLKDVVKDKEKIKEILNEVDNNGNNLLHIAINSSAALSIVKSLIEDGVDKKVRNSQNQTPLHLACKSRISSQKEFIELLLDKEINNEVDTDGYTALHYAVENGYGITAEFLLQNKVEPNIQNLKGQTPLILAIKGSHETIMTHLLKKGANPNLKAFLIESGPTLKPIETYPLDLAIKEQNHTAVNTLIWYGADKTEEYIKYKNTLAPDNLRNLEKIEEKSLIIFPLDKEIEKRLEEWKGNEVAGSGLGKLNLVRKEINNLMDNDYDFEEIKKLQEDFSYITQSYDAFISLEKKVKDPKKNEGQPSSSTSSIALEKKVKDSKKNEGQPSSSTSTSFFASIFSLPKISSEETLKLMTEKLNKDKFVEALNLYSKYQENQISKPQKEKSL